MEMGTGENKAMQRKQDGLVAIGEDFGGLGGPLKALRKASLQAIPK